MKAENTIIFNLKFYENHYIKSTPILNYQLTNFQSVSERGAYIAELEKRRPKFHAGNPRDVIV